MSPGRYGSGQHVYAFGTLDTYAARTCGDENFQAS